ncbi:hypothetical protein [Dasania marina]|uniref:hypothetical protein n=1 Tax=Dasania marina TaxID=471499 RepID=UPI0030DBCC03
MQAIFLLLLILFAIAYMLFMAALPSIFMLAICLAIYKVFSLFNIKKLVSIPIIIIISIGYSFNERLTTIGHELFSGDVNYKNIGSKINLTDKDLISFSSNVSDIKFKEGIFDSVSYYCNEGTGCRYRRPKYVNENVREIILNTGLKLTSKEHNILHLDVTEKLDKGVSFYQLRLEKNGHIISQEQHRRRKHLGGEEYIFYPHGVDFKGYERYVFSNTLWDIFLRSLFNKKQAPFLEKFITKNISISPSKKEEVTFLSKVLSGIDLNKDYAINNYPNIYHPIGCDNKNIDRSILVKGNKRYTTLTLLVNEMPTRIIEEYHHLNKIICTIDNIYFIYLSKENPNIKVSRYDYQGEHLITEHITTPELSWNGSPRISYFEHAGGVYTIEIREYIRKHEEPKNSIILSTDQGD